MISLENKNGIKFHKKFREMKKFKNFLIYENFLQNKYIQFLMEKQKESSYFLDAKTMIFIENILN